MKDLKKAYTSNNQSLGSADEIDATERSGSSAVLCVSFTRYKFKTRVFRLREVEGPNARDQIAFSAFHSLLVVVQMNAVYIQSTPDNSNLQGKSKKVRVIGSSNRELEENSRELGKKQFLLHSEHFNHI